MAEKVAAENVESVGGISDERREALRQAAESRPRTKDGRFAPSTTPSPVPTPSQTVPPKPAPHHAEGSGCARPKCRNCRICPVAEQMRLTMEKYPNGDAPDSETAPIRRACAECTKPMCLTESLHAEPKKPAPPAEPLRAPSQTPYNHSPLGQEGLLRHALHHAHDRLAEHPLMKLLPIPFPSLDKCDDTTRAYISFLLERLSAETNSAEKYRSRYRRLLYGIAALGLLAFNFACAYVAHIYWK